MHRLIDALAGYREERGGYMYGSEYSPERNHYSSMFVHDGLLAPRADPVLGE